MAKQGKTNFAQFAKMKGEVVTAIDGNIFKFENEGDTFIGKYLSSQIISGQNDPFTAYNFETDKGNISFSGGVSFESKMRLISINSVIRVTYNGKKKTKTKGRKVNDYTVELLQGKINEAEKVKMQKEIKERSAKIKPAKKEKK